MRHVCFGSSHAGSAATLKPRVCRDYLGRAHREIKRCPRSSAIRVFPASTTRPRRVCELASDAYPPPSSLLAEVPDIVERDKPSLLSPVQISDTLESASVMKGCLRPLRDWVWECQGQKTGACRGNGPLFGSWALLPLQRHRPPLVHTPYPN